jgi:hypothetical protein
MVIVDKEIIKWLSKQTGLPSAKFNYLRLLSIIRAAGWYVSENRYTPTQSSNFERLLSTHNIKSFLKSNRWAFYVVRDKNGTIICTHQQLTSCLIHGTIAAIKNGKVTKNNQLYYGDLLT